MWVYGLAVATRVWSVRGGVVSVLLRLTLEDGRTVYSEPMDRVDAELILFGLGVGVIVDGSRVVAAKIVSKL